MVLDFFCGYHRAEEWHFSLICGKLRVDVFFHLMKIKISLFLFIPCSAVPVFHTGKFVNNTTLFV